MARPRNEALDEENVDSEIEESGESLFGSNYLRDYRPRPDLDYYSLSDASETNTEQVSFYHEEQVQVTSLFAKLKAFLNTKTKALRDMCTKNEASFYVSYMELEKSVDVTDLVRDTEPFMEVFDEALAKVIKDIFPNYHHICAKVHVRLKDVPIVENIRSLRNVHLGTLVKVHGVVTRRGSIIPMFSLIMYTCGKCRTVFGPLVYEMDVPRICINCQSKGPHSINSTETIYKDLQRITLQEIPGNVPSGRLPRQKIVHLTYDLIDSVRPGEEVEITGIYKNSLDCFTARNGPPVFSTIIHAIAIEKKEDAGVFADAKEMNRLGRHPRIKNIVLDSIAPFIYGHKFVKKAVALAMFGGERKEHEGHSIRGDINVLLIGDPGTAKSQFLRYVESTSHRAVLASGQGASSVGLTATVRRDNESKEWTLEGGALVLSDRGICCIDEFDKMNDVDRVSIHEAMEQQSISIAKAGIVTSLHARCSVIAAANPKRGRYNSSLTFAQNVNLTDPIISRFDILCVIKDVVGGEDKITGDFIVNSHIKTMNEILEGNKENDNFDEATKKEGIIKDENGNDILAKETLKKYILYARKNCHPLLSNIDKEKISKLYSDLRKESSMTGSIPITARHIESIIRMSEAFARMRLSDQVLSSDVDSAIEVALESFMSAQKYNITKALRKKFFRFINSGDDALVYILNELHAEKMALGIDITTREFEKRLQNVGLTMKSDFYGCDAFKRNGYVIKNGVICLQ